MSQGLCWCFWKTPPRAREEIRKKVGILQLPALRGQCIHQQNRPPQMQWKSSSSSSTPTVCTEFVKIENLWWWSSRDDLSSPQILLSGASIKAHWAENRLQLLSARTLQIPELPPRNKLQNLISNKLYLSRKRFPACYPPALLCSESWTSLYSIFLPQSCQWRQKPHCTIASKYIFPWH